MSIRLNDPEFSRENPNRIRVRQPVGRLNKFLSEELRDALLYPQYLIPSPGKNSHISLHDVLCSLQKRLTELQQLELDFFDYSFLEEYCGTPRLIYMRWETDREYEKRLKGINRKKEKESIERRARIQELCHIEAKDKDVELKNSSECMEYAEFLRLKQKYEGEKND